MKKFLACSLIAMLACGALLAGCGGDKKDEAAVGNKWTSKEFFHCLTCVRNFIF